MRTHPAALVGFVLAAAAPALAQEQTVFFRGLPGNFGVLEERDVNSQGAPTLPLGTTPLRLLPLEVNGRTELRRHDPAKAWRFDDVPRAARIALPADQGSIYRFEADQGGGARSFGFFLVDAAGSVRILVERAGIGAANDVDPFLPRIAAADDGTAILCATTAPAGGDLLEVRLDTGLVLDRTQAEPPRAWLGQSLSLLPQWGLAMHRGGVQHFARQAGAQVAPATFPSPVPAWYSGEIVAAENGAFAAFVAGASPQAADVWVISQQGALARATPQPAAISSAGFLPEQLDGPFLAVSDDGARCAWRSEGATREAFLALVPWQTAPSAAHLTSNANFIDTIDEVGQMAFRPGAKLVFTAGERALAAGGIDKIDVFEAALPSAGPAPTLQNLSQSSGILGPPFLLPGAIKPEGGVELPGGGRLLVDRNLDELVLLAPQGGPPATVLAAVKAFEGSARSGDRWILFLRRSNGAQPRQVVSWSPSAPFTTSVLYSSTSVDSFERSSVRGDACAFVERGQAGVRLHGCDLATGAVQLFSTQPWELGPAIAITSSGLLTASLNAPPAPAVVVRWRVGNAPRRLGPVTGAGFLLRGL